MEKRSRTADKRILEKSKLWKIFNISINFVERNH